MSATRQPLHQFDPVTGLRQRPIPSELEPIARGRWRSVFAAPFGAERYIWTIDNFEELERESSLDREQAAQLVKARNDLAHCWLGANGVMSTGDWLVDTVRVASGRTFAEIARVDGSGFWYRRDLHDCTHFVEWPWYRSAHPAPVVAINKVIGWLREGIRVPRFVAIIGWMVLGLLLLRFLTTL